MAFRGTNTENKETSFSGTPKWLGFQEVALTDVVDRSDDYPNMDMFLEFYFRNGNSQYPYKYALLGTFEREANNDISGDSGLLKKIVYLCDALDWNGGVNKDGNWVDDNDKEIKDIASYINLHFTANNYGTVKNDDEDDHKYYIFTWNKYNEKAGKSYPTVCSKIAKNTNAEKADLVSYVDWMKANKYIVEHDNTKEPVVANGVASTASSNATFDKF